MKYLTRSDFRAACGGIVKSALSKAEATGKVTATEAGMIPLDEVNRFYLEGMRFKKIEHMTLTGCVLPGWAVLCAMIDGRKVPLCYYAPLGLSDDDVIEAEGAPDFRLLESGKVEMDGQLYEGRLVYDRTPPPWLTDAVAAGEKVRARGRASRRAASAEDPRPEARGQRAHT